MTLENIGQKLKAARESQGLTLAEIYQRTKIPVNHLQAIDDGNMEDLPEPVYVSGFIRRYADCVGLSGQLLADEYRKGVGEADVSGNGRKPARAARATLDTPIPVVLSSPQMYKTKVQTGGPGVIKSLAFYSFWIIFVLGIVTFLFAWNTNNSGGQSDQSLIALRDSASRFNTLPPSDPAAMHQQPTQAPAQPAQPQGAQINLVAGQHVWVDIKKVSDGTPLYVGYLEAGDRRSYQDSQGIRVRAGNGGSLTVEYDGKVETFGQAGKIAERAFMAKSTMTATDGGTVATTAAATPVKPVVKKVVKRPAKRSDDGGGRSYAPGESLGGGSRSIDVPYRYTEGRLDTD